MLLDAHQEYNQLFGDDDWFDVDIQVCSFKRNVHYWPREAAQWAKTSKCSSRGSRNVSDKGSMNSKKSNVIKGQGDRKKDESSLVDCRSWSPAAEANDSEWGRVDEYKGKISQGQGDNSGIQQHRAWKW